VASQIAGYKRATDKTQPYSPALLPGSNRGSQLFQKRGGRALNQSDPTDHALAAIASMLDQPEANRVADKPAAPDTPAPLGPTSTPDGYCKIGPGPIAAIRFRWTVRCGDDGQYYVDETIGENSLPVVTGPMRGEEAIAFVDDRESESRRRFELLRTEMAGRGAAATLVRRNGGES
jgi:hypothetical protein